MVDGGDGRTEVAPAAQIVVADVSDGAATPCTSLHVAHDPESRDWLVRLSGEGRERERAGEELHALLVKAARFTLAKRRCTFPDFPREALDDLATEAAGEALIAILAHLDD